jgi:hypothetical protein
MPNRRKIYTVTETLQKATYTWCLDLKKIYRPVSVSTVSVIRCLPQPEKKEKKKEN